MGLFLPNPPIPMIPRRLLAAACGLLALLVVTSGCRTPADGAAARRPGTRLVAVMGAYTPELEANESVFLEQGRKLGEETVNGVRFVRIRFGDHDLLLFSSGVSMVNAAMMTQLAIDRFHVDTVLFAGIAGAIDPARHIGDVVVPQRWHHHSEAAYLNPRPDGTGYVIPKYFQPPHENFGFLFPDHVWAIRDGMRSPARQPYFEADPVLLEVARKAAATAPPMEYRGRRAELRVGGDGIAGPVFMDNREYRKWAFRVWNAQCLDMESTAIAQVCWANKVPCLVVRSLSDLAGGQEGLNDADFTEGPVARHAALFLREVVRNLPADR